MRLIPIVSGLMLVATAAFAQPAPDAPPPDQQYQAPPAPQGHRAKFDQKFQAANTTHDGRLTLEQAQAGRMKHIVQSFNQIDADHKGYVTEQDIIGWRHAMHQAKATQQAPQQ